MVHHLYPPITERYLHTKICILDNTMTAVDHHFPFFVLILAYSVFLVSRIFYNISSHSLGILVFITEKSVSEFSTCFGPTSPSGTDYAVDSASLLTSPGSWILLYVAALSASICQTIAEITGHLLAIKNQEH